MSTNDRNLRSADDGGSGDVDVGVSQRPDKLVSLATVIIGRPLPPPEQITEFTDVNSLVGDCDRDVDSVVRDFDTLRHRRKLRNEKRRRNSSNGLSAPALRTSPLPRQSKLSAENESSVGGTIKLLDLCLRFCFFDLGDCGDNGGGEIDTVGDKHSSNFCTDFLLDFRRKLIVSFTVFPFVFDINSIC